MLGEESPGRQNWPRIQGPIDNYGLEWGRVLEPLKQNFTVDPEDSSSESSEPFLSSPSDSSLGGRWMLCIPLRLRAVMTWGTTRGGKKTTGIVRTFVLNFVIVDPNVK